MGYVSTLAQVAGATHDITPVVNETGPVALTLYSAKVSYSITGQPSYCKTTAPVAGGSLTAGGILLSSTASLGVFVGSGAPTISAAKGSLYLRTDGSTTATRAYIATDAVGTWTPITTVA